ncbi:MAG: Brix domain-containing protein [Candidatus Methanofastidiosia archaeon]
MLVTTSRHTSQRTRTFCKELASIFPLCEYVTRGKKGIKDLLDYAFRNGHDRVLIVETKYGNPSSISYLLVDKGLKWKDSFDITVKTRKDLKIKLHVPPIVEDLGVCINSSISEPLTKRISCMFGATVDKCDIVMQLSRTTQGTYIDFIRKDISDDPIGPRIKVIASEYEN